MSTARLISSLYAARVEFGRCWGMATERFNNPSAPRHLSKYGAWGLETLIRILTLTLFVRQPMLHSCCWERETVHSTHLKPSLFPLQVWQSLILARTEPSIWPLIIETGMDRPTWS